MCVGGGYKLIWHRIQSLIVPICCWSIIPFGVTVSNGNISSCGLSGVIYIYIRSVLTNLWFLWAVFWCSIVVIVVETWLHDSKIVYLIGLVITFFIPDIFNLALYKFMYPFFLIGYFCHKTGYDKKLKKYCNKTLTVILGILFFSLMLLYNYDSYIYTSGYDIWGTDPVQQVGIDIYRFAVGIFGSVFIMVLLSFVIQIIPPTCMRVFEYIGKNTIGIYIISTYIFLHVLPMITGNVGGLNYLLVALETVVILGITLAGTESIKHIKVLNKFLLGGRS